MCSPSAYWGAQNSQPHSTRQPSLPGREDLIHSVHLERALGESNVIQELRDSRRSCDDGSVQVRVAPALVQRGTARRSATGPLDEVHERNCAHLSPPL